MEFFIEPIPTWALCYLINGDPTGLTDDEIAMIDNGMPTTKCRPSPPLRKPRESATHISPISLLSDYLPKSLTAM